MLVDAIRWNALNLIRVELFFNSYKLYQIFLHSSFKSPRAQYAVASFLITLVAQTCVQFNWTWLLQVYAIYLAAGMCLWLYRRVYFYHRRLDSHGVNQTINQFDTNRSLATGATFTTKYPNKTNPNSSNNSPNNGTNGLAPSANDNTNSLQRQRASAYRDFCNALTEPRHNHREYVMSLAHLSHVSKLAADKDVFDEMHFQILATRRDVVNIILRAILLVVTTIFAYV